MANYTNEDMMKMYHNLASRYSGIFEAGKIFSRCQKIRDSGISLQEHHNKYGNFENLDIFDSLIASSDDSATKKANKKANEIAKTYLNLIAENGYEGAIEKIELEKAEKMGTTTLKSLETALTAA